LLTCRLWSPGPAPLDRAIIRVLPGGRRWRSDFPSNQINNVLAFPGFFRGLLDGAVRDITDSMLIAAAVAIADRVAPDGLNASYIIPSVFDWSVAGAVAHAVREAEAQ
jgi:malate dehydrogenase (oxaloacetate-decarboxylating)